MRACHSIRKDGGEQQRARAASSTPMAALRVAEAEGAGRAPLLDDRGFELVR